MDGDARRIPHLPTFPKRKQMRFLILKRWRRRSIALPSPLPTRETGRYMNPTTTKILLATLESRVRKTLTEQSMDLFGTDCEIKEMVDVHKDGSEILIRLSGIVGTPKSNHLGRYKEYRLTEEKMSLMRRAFDGFEVSLKWRHFSVDTGEATWGLQTDLLYRHRTPMSAWDAFRRSTPALEMAAPTISALSLLILLIVTWHYLQANQNPWM